MAKKAISPPVQGQVPQFIFGADLSLRRPGFALIECKDNELKFHQSFVVDTTKKSWKDAPYAMIFDHITEALENASFWIPQGTAFVREAAIGTFAHATTMTLNKVVGVVDLWLYRDRHETWEEPLRPVSIKKLVTGSGKASKDEVRDSIQQYFRGPLSVQYDDESDACAVVIAWLLWHGVDLKRFGQKDKENP